MSLLFNYRGWSSSHRSYDWIAAYFQGLFYASLSLEPSGVNWVENGLSSLIVNRGYDTLVYPSSVPIETLLVYVGSGSTLQGGFYLDNLSLNAVLPNHGWSPILFDGMGDEIVSVKEEKGSSSLSFRFYPNPCQNWVFLDRPAVLYNLLGQQIQLLSVGWNQLNLPAGVYFLKNEQNFYKLLILKY